MGCLRRLTNLLGGLLVATTLSACGPGAPVQEVVLEDAAPSTSAQPSEQPEERTEPLPGYNGLETAGTILEPFHFDTMQEMEDFAILIVEGRVESVEPGRQFYDDLDEEELATFGNEPAASYANLVVRINDVLKDGRDKVDTAGTVRVTALLVDNETYDRLGDVQSALADQPDALWYLRESTDPDDDGIYVLSSLQGLLVRNADDGIDSPLAPGSKLADGRTYESVQESARST
jgi:hypothetical protein